MTTWIVTIILAPLVLWLLGVAVDRTILEFRRWQAVEMMAVCQRCPRAMGETRTIRIQICAGDIEDETGLTPEDGERAVEEARRLLGEEKDERV